MNSLLALEPISFFVAAVGRDSKEPICRASHPLQRSSPELLILTHECPILYFFLSTLTESVLAGQIIYHRILTLSVNNIFIISKLISSSCCQEIHNQLCRAQFSEKVRQLLPWVYLTNLFYNKIIASTRLVCRRKNVCFRFKLV